MNRAMRAFAAALALLCWQAPARAQQPVPAPSDTAVADTTASAPAAALTMARGAFAVMSKDGYLRRHAYSFDHYLEFEPSLVLARRGPIGADVRFSRFGIGRGRGVIVHNGIVLNDPQNGVAPAVHFPASAIGTVSVVDADPRADGIEGVVVVDDLPAPGQRPRTFLELSKGTNELRQRRVYFSSARSAVGIDLCYDELLNDGYGFDATETVGLNVPEYGGSTSRQIGVRVRGEHEDGGRYAASFREFTSTFRGDLSSSAHRLRRSGHLASASASLGRLGVRFYERGFSASYPDSHTVNQTTAAFATLALYRSATLSAVLDGGVEDISATQEVGGGESNPELTHTSASITATAALGGALRARAYLSGADYHGYLSQWGGGVSVGGHWDRMRLGLDARRSFRMPTLGELFLPEHTRGTTTVAGNRYLDAEYAWELSGRVGVAVGPFTNELRVTGIRVKDPVALRDGGGVFIPVNAGGALLYTIEERVRVEGGYRGFEFRGDVAASFTEGDRVGFFASSPRADVRASVRIGGSLFEATSALFAGAEYVRGGERVGFSGYELPSYEVFNFRLDGRLLDADMYLALFNAFDERYRTEGDFLMTPRTFVYGIAWTLWE